MRQDLKDALGRLIGSIEEQPDRSRWPTTAWACTWGVTTLRSTAVPPEYSVGLVAQRLTSLGRNGLPTYDAGVSWRREG